VRIDNNDKDKKEEKVIDEIERSKRKTKNVTKRIEGKL
jgi:hypothetical protein